MRATLRPARELEPGDQVALFGRWFTIDDVYVEAPLVRLTFTNGSLLRLRPFHRVPCAA